MMVPSHMAFVGGAGALWGLGLEGCAALAIGSAFPDIADSVIAGRNREVWKGIHRTITHWPPLYPGLLAILFFSGQAIPEPWAWYSLLFVLGALAHTVLDFLTPMGIPVIPPFRRRDRVSIPLVRTGTLADYGLGFAPLIVYLITSYHLI